MLQHQKTDRRVAAVSHLKKLVKDITMKANNIFTMEVTSIDKVCAAGEIYGRQ